MPNLYASAVNKATRTFVHCFKALLLLLFGKQRIKNMLTFTFRFPTHFHDQRCATHTSNPVHSHESKRDEQIIIARIIVYGLYCEVIVFFVICLLGIKCSNFFSIFCISLLWPVKNGKNAQKLIDLAKLFLPIQ